MNQQNKYFYKVIEVWCKWPWQDQIEERYVEFYERSKRKWVKMEGLRMESNTSIKEKEDYLKERLGIKKCTVTKIK